MTYVDERFSCPQTKISCARPRPVRVVHCNNWTFELLNVTMNKCLFNFEMPKKTFKKLLLSKKKKKSAKESVLKYLDIDMTIFFFF